MTDSFFMNQAIEEAKKAGEMDDVPVGAVIVKDGVVIARAGNMREQSGDATAHAELLAIREANKQLGRWRLSDCEMYVTMEPCPMCAGAIVNARIPRVIVGVKDAKAGAFGSVMNLNCYPLNHKVEMSFDCLAEESRECIRNFFAKKRKK